MLIEYNFLLLFCFTHSGKPGELSAEIRLHVNFAPSEVVIAGQTEARRGELVRMSCVTGPSNPAAEISWVVDGRLVNSTNRVVLADQIPSLDRTLAAIKSSTNTASRIQLVHQVRSAPALSLEGAGQGNPMFASHGGYVTLAELTLQLKPDERNAKSLNCYAVNQALAETVIKNSVLNVLCKYTFSFSLYTPF